MYIVTIETKDGIHMEVCHSKKDIKKIHRIMDERRFLQLNGKCIAIKHIVMIQEV